jgi:hypothetical protein
MMRDRSGKGFSCDIRRSRCFKAASAVLLAYLLIAALHGLVPQLWSHHYLEGRDDGPFRVLLFTLVIAAGLAVVLACALNRQFFQILPVVEPESRVLRRAWSLRSPPFLA